MRILLFLLASPLFGQFLPMFGSVNSVSSGGTVTDTFSRSSIGANWSDAGSSGGSCTQIAIASSTYAYDTNAGAWSACYNNTRTFTNDQSAEATLTIGSASAIWSGPAVRVSSSANSFYLLGFETQIGNNAYYIILNNAGSASILSNGAAVCTPIAGTKVALTVTGTTLTAWEFCTGSWSMIVQITDSTLSAGYAGLGGFNPASDSTIGWTPWTGRDGINGY